MLEFPHCGKTDIFCKGWYNVLRIISILISAPMPQLVTRPQQEVWNQIQTLWLEKADLILQLRPHQIRAWLQIRTLSPKKGVSGLRGFVPEVATRVDPIPRNNLQILALWRPQICPKMRLFQCPLQSKNFQKNLKNCWICTPFLGIFYFCTELHNILALF